DVRDGRALCSPLRDNLATYPVRIEHGVVFVAL
ncbi:non-heme iron oxygenase ferredoxin subunit, partial [Paraburkholderia sp. SIMBA_009]